MCPFEPIPMHQRAPQRALEPGRVTISGAGILTILERDLLCVGIAGEVMLLADATKLQIGLRPARKGESAAAVGVRVQRGLDTGRRMVNLGQVLRRLGVDKTAAAGRYRLRHETGDPERLLVIDLAGGAVVETRTASPTGRDEVEAKEGAGRSVVGQPVTAARGRHG